MELNLEDKTLIEYLLNKAYEEIDVIDDFKFDKELSHINSRDEMISAVKQVRQKLDLKGQTLWDSPPYIDNVEV
jgi:hypothetical protein